MTNDDLTANVSLREGGLKVEILILFNNYIIFISTQPTSH